MPGSMFVFARLCRFSVTQCPSLCHKELVSAGASVRRGPAGAFAAAGGLAVLEPDSGFCGFDVAVVAAAELHAAV